MVELNTELEVTDGDREASLYESITYNLDSPGYFNQLDILKEFATGQNILDIGCGPVLHLVALAYSNAKRIVGFDLLQANLDYVKDMLEAPSPSEKQKKLLRYLYGTDQRSFDLNKNIELVQGDAREFQPQFADSFDTVLQLGCFGCFERPEEFFYATKHCYAYLKPGGRLIFVNWTRTALPAGLNPLYAGDVVAVSLSKDMYEEAIVGAGLEIEAVEESDRLRPLSKERGHRSILWAVARKS